MFSVPVPVPLAWGGIGRRRGRWKTGPKRVNEDKRQEGKSGEEGQKWRMDEDGDVLVIIVIIISITIITNNPLKEHFIKIQIKRSR